MQCSAVQVAVAQCRQCSGSGAVQRNAVQRSAAQCNAIRTYVPTQHPTFYYVISSTQPTQNFKPIFAAQTLKAFEFLLGPTFFFKNGNFEIEGLQLKNKELKLKKLTVFA